MTYPQAQTIARELANASTEAAKMLRVLCEQTGRSETFIIMRYGDPRCWPEAPQLADARNRSKIPHPTTIAEATKIVKQVEKADGYAAVALRRRSRVRRPSYGPLLSSLPYIVFKEGDPRHWPEVVKGLHSKKARRELALARSCTLEHSKTGKVIKADSIVQFCEQAKLDGNARYHITPVLNGDRTTYKGWCLPDFLNQSLNLKDIYGNQYEMTVRDWVRKHGSPGSAHRLLAGRKKSISNSKLMLASTLVDSPLSPRSQHTIEVKLTDGKRTYSGRSIHEAAQAAGLKQPGSLYQCAYGFRDEARGLRVKSIKMERKRVLEVI